MAEGLWRADGGILGLLELVTEHREAVEFELLERGYGIGDIGTLTLSWTELRVLIRRWVSLPHNALAESIAGYSVWSIGEQLLAMLVDSTAWSNYIAQRAAGGKPAKPQPLPRPWDAKPQTYGSGALPYDQIDAWIASTTDDGE